jgi:hypothetical protein
LQEIAAKERDAAAEARKAEQVRIKAVQDGALVRIEIFTV